MAKYDDNIVGWITRGGKRIPIRKGEGHAKGKKPLQLEDKSAFAKAAGFDVASPKETANTFSRNVKGTDSKVTKPDRLDALHKDREKALTRELGELQRAYSLTDKSEENIRRGKRIKEIRAELDLVSEPRKDRRPPRLRWK